MKKSEIKVGGHYTAKVNGRVVTVRVDNVRESQSYRSNSPHAPTTLYDVTNLATGRKTTFRSAAKFIKKAADPSWVDTAERVRQEEQEMQAINFVNEIEAANLQKDPHYYDHTATGVEDNTESAEGEHRPDPQTSRGGKRRQTDTPLTGTRSSSAEARNAPKQTDSKSMSNTTPPSSPDAAAAKPAAPQGRRDTPLASLLRESVAMRKNQSEGGPPHVIVEARAGTGKTTTLIEGLKKMRGLPVAIEPSPQQAAVWEQLMLSKDARSVCMVAFNKSIATELQQRVPPGCDAMTMHSIGFRAVNRAFDRLKVNNYRVQDLISAELEVDIRELRKTKFETIKAVEVLVGLCKMNLVYDEYPVAVGDSSGKHPSNPGLTEFWWAEKLSELADYYDVELNGNREEVFRLVPKIIDLCKDPRRDGCVDFSDMVWLPVVLNLNVQTYDLLLVDEAQDLNRCQQALAKKAGRRLVFVGDPKQSIYGFAGADCKSMERLAKELAEDGCRDGKVFTPSRGCVTLPLTVTRRCGKAIVAEANRYVPDFEAHESNGEGKISRHTMDSQQMPVEGSPPYPPGYCAGGYAAVVEDGDMILCRVNAPLVSQCFRFLKAGRRANIIGRDVGQGLISTVKKMKTDDVAELTARISDWLHAEVRKENDKRNPSEVRIIALQDRHDCLMCFTDGARTTDDVIRKIEAVFTDDRNGRGIRLSSVHKSKGLEAKRVFILKPKGAEMPHPLAKQDWAREQEANICYVAITRAIEELVWVS